jgi:hypothetical protein
MTYLPHRYTTKSVDRFIPVLEAVCRQSYLGKVEQVEFFASDLFLSMNTAMARLRDAVHAITTGIIVDPRVPADVLRAMWPKYRLTSHNGTKVLLVPRNTEQTPTTLNVESGEQRRYLAVLDTDRPRFEETLTAFACLLGQRILEGSVLIEGPLSETLVAVLLDRHDIMFRQETSTTTIML